MLGLDVGGKRIGVAVSDELELTAQGLCVVTRRTDKHDIETIGRLVKEYDVGEIVLGLPLRLDGTEGIEARRLRSLAAELERSLGVTTLTWDERLTSREAERHLIQANVRRRRRKEVIDKVAASIILQSYLDWRAGRREAGEEGG